MGGSADEFPLLSALGLYAADIRGDGNCLFNALSDQIYGSQDKHDAIRARVIEYMREHADYYKQFIDVHPGGGTRRNPKRKNAGAYSSPADIVPPTEADVDRVFESHLTSMARGGTYGDNMEISAFTSAFDVDVKIYQRDFAYMVSAGDADHVRDVAHIAYHTWEHYSSIRNLDGPHQGPPDVRLRALSTEEEQRQKERLEQAPVALPWQIDVVSKSLPFLADKPTIKRALEECKGNIDSAVSKLLDAEEGGSASSAQESSSVEREPDSDDEAYHGPNKKQDRRLSRAARHADGSERRKMMSKLSQNDNDGSQESVASTESDTSSMPTASQDEIVVDKVSDTDSIKVEGSGSDSPAQPRGPRLRLKGPRPPDEMSPASKSRQKQLGPNVRGPSARQKKDMKKQAQKVARRERAQKSAQGGLADSKLQTGMALRSKGMTDTPPIESGFRTLYI